jgi:hypothetical protein
VCCFTGSALVSHSAGDAVCCGMQVFCARSVLSCQGC